MPLSINVGLSRKASRDFQSTGASINIVAELDQSLLAKPHDLQREIDGLYQQAEEAINRNSAASPPGFQSPSPSARANGRIERRSGGPGNGYAKRPGGGTGSGRGNGGGMTESQRRAIEGIARRLNVDPALEARAILGVELAELTIRQASELIDHLSSLSPAGNGQP